MFDGCYAALRRKSEQRDGDRVILWPTVTLAGVRRCLPARSEQCDTDAAREPRRSAIRASRTSISFPAAFPTALEHPGSPSSDPLQSNRWPAARGARFAAQRQPLAGRHPLDIQSGGLRRPRLTQERDPFSCGNRPKLFRRAQRTPLQRSGNRGVIARVHFRGGIRQSPGRTRKWRRHSTGCGFSR
jgi:hypothetical protein